jgi:hypothetical protein
MTTIRAVLGRSLTAVTAPSWPATRLQKRS